MNLNAPMIRGIFFALIFRPAFDIKDITIKQVGESSNFHPATGLRQNI